MPSLRSKFPLLQKRAKGGASDRPTSDLELDAGEAEDIETSMRVPRQLESVARHRAAPASYAGVPGDNEDEGGGSGSDEEVDTVGDAINDSKTFKELLKKLKTYADEDKEEADVIPGSIYRAWGFGLSAPDGDRWFATATIFVVITQAVAPFVIALYAYEQLDFSNIKWFDISAWYGPDVAITPVATKILATLLLFVFLVNEALVVSGEIEAWVKCRLIIKHGRSFKRSASTMYFYLGAFWNACSSIMVSIDTMLLMLMATAGGSPTDVVMNILGLTFLRTMDDVAGDLGFLGDLDWDEKVMGKYFFESTCSEAGIDPPGKVPEDIQKEETSIIHVIWRLTIYLFAIVFPIMFIIISGVAEAESDDGEVTISGTRGEVQVLKKQVDLLNATVNANNIQLTQLASQMYSLAARLPVVVSNTTMR